MRLLPTILTVLFLFTCIRAFATPPLEPGLYTVFDRYGEPLRPDPALPETQVLDSHLAKARKGGSLVLSTTGAMDLVFPAWHKDGIQQQIMPYPELIFEPLMKPDPRGETRTLYSHLAESITVKNDKRTFVISLRPDVTFSDGSRLRAEDVLASWKFTKNVENGPTTAAALNEIYGDPKINVIDDRNVEVSFPDVAENKQRGALFYFLIRKVVKEKSGTFDIPSSYIGTGAYVVTAAARDRVRLKRRSDYWANAQPYFNFDDIRIESFLTPSITREALKANAINFLAEDNFNGVRGLEEFASGAYYTSTRASRHDSGDEESRTMLLIPNLTKPPLDDLRVRQAIAYAFDFSHASKNFFGGTYSYATSLGSSSRFRPSGPPSAEVLAMMEDLQFKQELLKPFEDSGLQEINKMQDRRSRLRRASMLLREAGYQIEGGRASKNGKPLRFEVITSPGHERMPQLLHFKELLQFIGIELSVRQFGDHTSYVKAVHGNNYDFTTLRLPWPRQYSVLDAEGIQMWLESASSSQRYPKGMGLNASNLESPALDAILEQLRLTAEESPRFKQLNEALIRFLSVTISYIPMGDPDFTTYFHDRKICVAPRTLMAMISAYTCQ